MTGYDRVTFLSARFRNCSAHRPALFRKRATRAFPDSAASFFSPRFDSIRTFHIRAVLLLQPIPNFNFSELELLFFFSADEELNESEFQARVDVYPRVCTSKEEKDLLYAR